MISNASSPIMQSMHSNISDRQTGVFVDDEVRALVVADDNDFQILHSNQQSLEPLQRSDNVGISYITAETLPQVLVKNSQIHGHPSPHFTSRDGSIASEFIRAESCVELEAAMTEDEAITAFKSALQESRFDNADIKRVVRRLHYLPLAINQAAAYIRENGIHIDEYLHKLDKSEIELLLVSVREMDETVRAIMATWKLSYDCVRNQNVLATDLLDVMACLDFQEIQWTLLRSEGPTANVNDIDFDTAMGLLQSFGLISPTASFSNYRVHQLVSLWTRQNIESKSETFRTALQIVLTVFSKYTTDWLREYETLLPHVEAILRHTVAISELQDDRIKLLFKAACYYSGAGQWSKSRRYFHECLLFRETHSGIEHPSTLDTVNTIANVYSDQGRYDEALELYRRALAGNEKSLGKEHPSTLNTVNNIAIVYSEQGRYEEALEWYGRALAGNEKALGKEHPSRLSTVNGIANVYSGQGRYDEALKLYRRALAGNEKALGKEHPSTLDMVNNMAVVYSKQGRYDEALELYGRTLVGKKSLGKEHLLTVDAMIFHGFQLFSN